MTEIREEFREPKRVEYHRITRTFGDPASRQVGAVTWEHEAKDLEDGSVAKSDRFTVYIPNEGNTSKYIISFPVMERLHAFIGQCIDEVNS